MNLRNVGAIVTGGASGLGAAVAEVLAEAGCRVAVFDVNESGGVARAAALGGVFCRVDVSDEVSVTRGIEAAWQQLGELRVLVNCAGIGTPERITGREGPHSLRNFTRTISVNLVGTFNCIRLLADRLRQVQPDAGGERGVIINAASVAAFEGQIGQAAYSASKGGIVGMTLPIARDLASLGIRVCTVAPGLFRTPLLESLPEESKASLAASVPFPRRLGEPAEFGGLVRHICENAMLNGEVIRLDGALRMAPR